MPASHPAPATSSPAVGAPPPTPVLATGLDGVLARFGCDPLDAAAIRAAVQQLGTIDATLGDRIGSDRMTLGDAAEAPLYRTAPEDLPLEGERPAYHADTVVTPSGRVFQVQRRYASELEISRFLDRGEPHDVPALWVRELLVPRVTAAARERLRLTYDATGIVDPADDDRMSPEPPSAR